MNYNICDINYMNCILVLFTNIVDYQAVANN